MSNEIKFFTDRANIHNGGNLIADFAVDVSAPWGDAVMRGTIIYSERDSRTRVLWPRNGDGRYHATPTRECLEGAERFVLAAWQERKGAGR